jgi:cellulose synthase/poly-beta-1,6-N-acetylglucosamine synthase-like glycosyltransferase
MTTLDDRTAAATRGRRTVPVRGARTGRGRGGLETSLVALGVASVSVGHLIYPVLLAAVASRRPKVPRPPCPAQWPAITAVVPAYLESGVIAKKVADLQSSGYPGPVEVLVVADGDPETAEVARAAGATVLLVEPRGGKSQALNAGVRSASNEIIVVSDANSHIEAGGLELLVQHLQRPEVAAVGGDKHEGEPGAGEGVYWRFESKLKTWESQLGWTLGLDGALFAIKKSAWRGIPRNISNDDFWLALDVADQGLQVLYEPEAAVREESIGPLALQWERRTRVLGGALYVVLDKRGLLLRNRLVGGTVLGHKLWRSSIGPVTHVLLLVHALASARRSRYARAFLAGHAALGAGVVWEAEGHDLPKPFNTLSHALFLQVVALGGLLRFLRRDRVIKWDKPAR